MKGTIVANDPKAVLYSPRTSNLMRALFVTSVKYISVRMLRVILIGVYMT